MKKLLIATAASMVALSGLAVAQEVTDVDGDGVYSLEELVAVYPDLTPETFAVIDANGDGVVDSDELTAARESGTLAN